MTSHNTASPQRVPECEIPYLKPFLPRIISLIVAIVGLIVLFKSVSIGMDDAQKVLINARGMNTDEYRLIQTNYIEIYKWIGIILFGVGLFQFIRPFSEGEKAQLSMTNTNKDEMVNDDKDS